MSDPWGQTQPGKVMHAKRRPWWFIPAIIAFVVLGAGSAVGIYLLTSQTDIVEMLSPSMTVTGTVTLDIEDMTNNGTECAGKRGYADLKIGTPVVVTDAVGKTVGMGAIVSAKEKAERCVMTFKVADVPKGSDFYGIAVSHRGVVQFSADDLSKPLQLTVG